MTLPSPQRQRWQPLRAGLVDLFYYDSEEFPFHDGRLLLRGNNGTGKSKVLALTLPFLLDGDLRPQRVEPDADAQKRMEWNLLLGGGHPYPERLGYTWLEFGRIGDDDTPVYRTIGCGLKAVQGRGIARHWYFVTDQRVGDELTLIDATGTALPRERLAEAIETQGRGNVYDRARDYRRAVDEALFSLGDQRYNALVDLLVQLRQPQLSKSPSQKALSAALTEALPPVDEALIRDVAEAFRSLEDDRETLRVMTEGRDAAHGFLEHYRLYARIAAHRRAKSLSTANANYEQNGRDLKAVHDQLATAELDIERAGEALDALATERSKLEAREQELQEDPTARKLHEAADESEKLAERAWQTVEDRRAATRRLDEWQRRADDKHAEAEQAAESIVAQRATASEAAAAARVTADHADRVDRLLDGDPDVHALEHEAQRVHDRQLAAAKHVGSLLDDVDDAMRAVTAAGGERDRADRELQGLTDRKTSAQQTLDDCGAELVAATRTHLEQAVELRVRDLAASTSALEQWVATLDGPNPVAAEVRDAGRLASEGFARALAELRERERAAETRLREVDDEADGLRRGENSAPPVPHTRSSAARSDKPGAPLWQLVDFTDDVSPADRAGIEAALEASGILDAWVMPSGDLVDTGGDVLLTPTTPVAHHLGTALEPAVDRTDDHASTVGDDTVAALLTSIGMGESGQTWVDTNGEFRIGVLRGNWNKPAATYIGRGAREAARRARLQELAAARELVTDELTTIAQQREAITGRRDVLEQEIAGVPSDDELRRCHLRITTLDEDLARAREAQGRAAEAHAAAQQAAQEARSALEEGATDVDLPADRSAVADVREALGEYRTLTAVLWPAVRALRTARRNAAEAAEQLSEARATAEKRAQQATEAEAEAEAAAETLRTLQEAVGSTVRDIEHKLTETRQRLRSNNAERNDAEKAKEKAVADRGKADGKREELERAQHERTAERDEAVERFRKFAATGLLTVALPEVEVADVTIPWLPNPAVALARRTLSTLPDIDVTDAAWDRAQRKVNDEFKTLQDTLSRYNNRASADVHDDGFVVAIEFAGRAMTVPELAEALTTEVSDRERLLNEQEREILETHLINEVASTLQELISEADLRVKDMNEELRARPTSTGMTLRLVWQPHNHGPAGLEEARRRLLRQSADAWSEDDRAAVGEFLQAQINDIRSREAGGTWYEHLTTALDYRNWHQFKIEIHQNGAWRPADGPASGGEKVLAASVPLFAAAASHYRSAGNPHAPRLVTLDEAFAGVDDNARAKYLGLLTAFDLDVVMTSEREWGCYPEVPGLGISQLSRRDGIDAVLVTNWNWDGHERSRVDA